MKKESIRDTLEVDTYLPTSCSICIAETNILSKSPGSGVSSKALFIVKRSLALCLWREEESKQGDLGLAKE